MEFNIFARKRQHTAIEREKETKVSEAVNLAQRSNGAQTEWLNALRQAREEDLREAESRSAVASQTGILTLALAPFGAFGLHRVQDAFNITEEQKIQMLFCCLLLLCVPLLHRYYCTGPRYPNTEYVLAAAKRANVRLDRSQMSVNPSMIRDYNEQQPIVGNTLTPSA